MATTNGEFNYDITAVQAVGFTAPANVKTRITKATICNTTAVAKIVQCWIDRGATTYKVSYLPLAANGVLDMDGFVGAVLKSGETVEFQADAVGVTVDGAYISTGT